jgi:hypothetical protein
LIAYLYLGAGVLFAAMGAMFIICRYDPFVGFSGSGATGTSSFFGGFCC